MSINEQLVRMWNEVSGGQVLSLVNGVHLSANRHTKVVAETCSSNLWFKYWCN